MMAPPAATRSKIRSMVVSVLRKVAGAIRNHCSLVLTDTRGKPRLLGDEPDCTDCLAWPWYGLLARSQASALFQSLGPEVS
jgi:hypothetical protein